VTLGSSTAPSLGTEMFIGISSSQSVTVWVPSGATGYGSSPTNTTGNNWGNGFRGGGWSGSSIVDVTMVESNIDLTITPY
jgi:hypothetical protein